MKAWLSASGKRRLPMVRQATTTECGLACVAMIAGYFGERVDLGYLRRRTGLSQQGVTLRSVTGSCADLGLSTRAIRCSIDELKKLRLPCILHWRFNHFVVLKSVRGERLVIHDPARGVRFETLHSVAEAFTGVAVESSPATAFRQTSVRRLALRDLVSFDAQRVRQFAAGLLLALVCEGLLLTTPLYLQITIDQVLARNDQALLQVLVLVFSALLLIQVLANTLRQLTFQYLGHIVVFDISARVLHRLLQLPLAYFRSRELGDVQHRVQALRQVQNFIVQSVPAIVLDLVFLLFIVGLMAFYDLQLTLLIAAALLLWCLWRAAITSLSLRRASDIAQAESSAQTHLLESLRAVQLIKMGNGERARESEWCNLLADNCNARIRAGNLQITDNTVRQLLFHGVRIAVIFLLAKRGLAGQVSIGMISAFVAYLGMFTTRSCGIVDRVLEYKVLAVPLDRLADLVFSETEASDGTRQDRSLGSIELRDVSFTYSNDEPDILQNCSALIRKSELTVIAGASGVGKSTLLQIIAGNVQVRGGEMLIGDVPSRHWSRRGLRDRMGVVFQGDGLLKGSIANNIALFDEAPDRDRIHAAAQSACIDADIEALPLAYETRIGDLGSSLSRGQTQRVLLARALYRQPEILLLDEATSGLDAETEKKVIRALSQLAVTRVVVSHSDQMLEAADVVLWLHNGRLLSSCPDLNP